MDLEGEQRPRLPDALGLLLLLAVPFAAFVLERRAERELSGPSPSAPEPSAPSAERRGADAELLELRLRLAPSALAELLDARSAMLSSGRVSIDSDAFVPAALETDGGTLAARVRLKGDQLDHLDTERFSLRVVLEEGAFAGMRRFSVQHPKTRQYLREWLFHACARDEGLLAPRASFVRVLLNGEPRGVYFLEEHFDAPLLESQGRREGPIVKFDESSFWQIFHQYRPVVPESVEPALQVFHAPVDAFGERRLAGDPTLAAELERALGQLRALQREMIDLAAGRGDLLRRRGAVVERLLDVARVARLNALQTLFVAHHGMVWHNLRFYFDPVRTRLEPISFDNLPGLRRSGFAPVGLALDPMRFGWLVRTCLQSGAYRQRVVGELGRLIEPGWTEAAFERHGADLERFAAALEEGGDLPPGEDPASIRLDLEAERMRLAEWLHPEPVVGIDGRLVLSEREDGTLSGRLSVDLWCRGTMPVVVERFELPDGRSIGASAAVAESEPWFAGLGGDGVCLPRFPSPCRFEADLDPRLVNLSSVEELVGKLQQGVEESFGAALDLTAVVRLPSEKTPRRMPFFARPVRAAWLDASALPAPPTVEEALARHECLAWSPDDGALVVRPGTWRIDGDLVLPRGVRLGSADARERSTLLFEPAAVLVARGALELGNTELGPSDDGAGWAGVLVLDASTPSRLEGVTVRGTNEIRRAGWFTTGGVTFYHCPAELVDCVFVDARGEDALNVFGQTVELLRCRFERTRSDAFDGDFVGGSARECVFVAIGADAIDTSGSRFSVVDCTFTDVGDKCVSAGEKSELEVRGGRIEATGLAVVSKDGSRVTVADTEIVAAEVAALAAYRKKPEYGAPELTATSVVLGPGVARAVLAQTGSRVAVDGVEQATSDFDVEGLYESGVLGN